MTAQDKYREALEQIADFDVETMTYDGFNEWGEAEAWGFARVLAEVTLGRTPDSCVALVPDEEGGRRACGHPLALHGTRWALDRRTYCQGCYVTPPAGDFDHHEFWPAAPAERGQ